jgi:hypothetical protein
MADYVAKWGKVSLATGQDHALTKEALVRTFNQGDVVKRDAVDSDVWRAKFDRLVAAGALVEPGSAAQDEASTYNSAFDIPLTNQPDSDVVVEVDEANDDIGEDGDEVATPKDPSAPADRPAESASTEVWRQYAQTHGVELANLDTAKRAEIIDATKAQGK